MYIDQNILNNYGNLMSYKVTTVYLNKRYSVTLVITILLVMLHMAILNTSTIRSSKLFNRMCQMKK